MSEPLVVAIMLTRDRTEMAARAVRCFREQTYRQKELTIYNTGRDVRLRGFRDDSRKNEWYVHDVDGQSVGILRNKANACNGGDIICHFDDDDWSHPNRIAEQVALLQASGAEAVGYHSMYFYEAPKTGIVPRNPATGDYDMEWGKEHVYLYDGSGGYPYGYVIGTSLCYWRSVWEKRPFLDVPESSDSKFCNGTDPEGRYLHEPLRTASVNAAIPREPRMIARIHPDSMQYKAGYRNRLDIPPWSLVTDAATIEQVRKVMEL
jgi:glycosyltransferase involved in cell wall biosynthesis